MCAVSLTRAGKETPLMAGSIPAQVFHFQPPTHWRITRKTGTNHLSTVLDCARPDFSNCLAKRFGASPNDQSAISSLDGHHQRKLFEFLFVTGLESIRLALDEARLGLASSFF